jgi:hypothetical protein
MTFCTRVVRTIFFHITSHGPAAYKKQFQYYRRLATSYSHASSKFIITDNIMTAPRGYGEQISYSLQTRETGYHTLWVKVKVPSATSARFSVKEFMHEDTGVYQIDLPVAFYQLLDVK